MERNHSVSLCMIVKNEADCLGRCLESMKGLVDEIIIVDTGSTDNTVEIAKQYGAVIKTYQWNNDFSQARNYSLSLATKEWILVLDADEYLRTEDTDLFISAINNQAIDSYYIKTLNFTEANKNESCMINLNHRLFKNNKGFHYISPIHEQLVNEQPVTSLVSDIGFYHTGYLKEVVNAKKKPNRNSEILQSILEKNPNDAFHQFNLANEMFQLGKYSEAIELYDKAYTNSTSQQGYMPKLMIFRINALIANHEDKKALMAANEGLKHFPGFTHLMFLKGTIEEKLGLITKAIQSYNNCLKLGKPTAQLEFSSGSEALWPHLKLAALYDAYGDYEQAVYHYNKYLELNPSHYQILYAVAPCLKKLGFNDEVLSAYLEKYIPANNINNQILLIDLLMKEQCYSVANTYLEKIEALEQSNQLVYLYAKNQFYLKNYDLSRTWFETYLQQDSFETISCYYYLMYLLTHDEAYGLEKLPYSIEFKTIHEHIQTENKDSFSNVEWNVVIRLMEEMLMLADETLIETFTHALTPVVDHQQLLQLSKIFSKHNRTQLATEILKDYVLKGGEIDGEYTQLLNAIQIDKLNEMD